MSECFIARLSISDTLQLYHIIQYWCLEKCNNLAAKKIEEKKKYTEFNLACTKKKLKKKQTNIEIQTPRVGIKF